MSKLKCVTHNRRVHVWDDGLGAVTVHREDGSRCVVNPELMIGGHFTTPSHVAEYWTKTHGEISIQIPDFPYMLPDC